MFQFIQCWMLLLLFIYYLDFNSVHYLQDPIWVGHLDQRFIRACPGAHGQGTSLSPKYVIIRCLFLKCYIQLLKLITEILKNITYDAYKFRLFILLFGFSFFNTFWVFFTFLCFYLFLIIHVNLFNFQGLYLSLSLVLIQNAIT